MTECNLNAYNKAALFALKSKPQTNQQLMEKAPPKAEAVPDWSKYTAQVAQSEESGSSEFTGLPRLTHSYASAVVYTQEAVKSPVFGAASLETWKDAFTKALQQAQGSPNLLVSKYYSFKAGALRFLLSLAGVSPGELEAMRRQALEELEKQNKLLFKENARNFVLLTISGGKNKKERRIMAEIEKQLALQAQRLGKPLSQIDLQELRLEQARIIRENLAEQVGNMKDLKELCELYGRN